MDSRKKLYLYAGLIVVGIVLIVLAAFNVFEVQKPVEGVMFGIGAGLAGMSFAGLASVKFYDKHPHLAKISAIEQKDERLLAIRFKARSKAATWTNLMLIIIAYVTILAELPLWLTLSLVGIYCAYHVLAIAYTVHYQNKM